MAGPRSPNGRGRRLKPAPAWVRIPSGALCWIASLAALALFKGSLRSLRCSLGSRRLRRLLLQIGGANIAGGDRALERACLSSSGTKSVSPLSSSVRRVARSEFVTGRAVLVAPPRRFRVLRRETWPISPIEPTLAVLRRGTALEAESLRNLTGVSKLGRNGRRPAFT
jgi:hypothetical protein